MEIKLFNRAQLHEFINSKVYVELSDIPISMHRALSHINNPRADQDDVLLMGVFEENELLAYLGMLPDLIKNSANIEIKFAWLSCLWIRPDQRGKRLGAMLVLKGLALWNSKLILTEFTPAAKKVYEKLNVFTEWEELHGSRFYFRMDLASWLPPKNSLFRHSTPILRGLDSFINTILDWLPKVRQVNSANLVIEYCHEIDQEAADFIEQHSKKSTFRRTKKELDWILNDPWIVSDPIQKKFANKYYFSSYDKSFQNMLVKLKDSSGQLKAFLFFTKRNHTLKLPYIFSSLSEMEVAPYIFDIVRSLRASSLTIFQEDLVLALQKNNRETFHTKKFFRIYLISKKLLEEGPFNGIEIQDGDGDCVFT
ncbi:MAG: hypothetical protein M3Q56_04575 [Bacteroidota bacterium]|nr:hypothetical protein [Bacteroidota bacterium]